MSCLSEDYYTGHGISICGSTQFAAGRAALFSHVSAIAFIMARIIEHDDIVGESLSDGRYRVLSLLGKGCMSRVYKAYDTRVETNVVLKVPGDKEDPTAQFLSRFSMESRLLSQLKHPHVVGIQDVGRFRNLPFAVMRFLSGGTLQDRIAEAKANQRLLDMRSLKDWVWAVARALDFVHSQNVVHRDVKPANILFDEHCHAFLSDFGLMQSTAADHRDLDAEQTAAGAVIGTPNYMAPEIILGRACDGRADQYSFGVSIYHALTGCPPMQGLSAAATMVNQTHKQLPLLSDVRSDVSVGVADAVARSLEKDPADRFGNCEQFAAEVLPAVSQQDKYGKEWT